MQSTQPENLKDAVSHIEEEARIMLPGIQALFGFQLIAVFNAPFKDLLNHHEQILHLAALTLVAISATLVLTPAAYHRQVEPMSVSKKFIEISTLLLCVALFPLALGTSLDFYLICRIILNDATVSAVLGSLLFAFMLFFWYGLPRLKKSSHPGA